MITPTYDLITSTTLAAATSTVTLDSIPQGYRDIVLTVSLTNGTTGTTGINLRLNGDAGANYTWRRMYGTGSTATDSGTSVTASFGDFPIAGVADLPTTIITDVMDYSATTNQKAFLTRVSDKGGYGDYVATFVSRWANTAAVTSLTFYGSKNFTVGSTFNLYGIAG